MTVRMARSLLIGAAALGSIGTIDAQQAAAQQVAQAAAGLEEIVVTARRREENIQSVPVAITAFSSEELRDKGIVSIEQLGRNTPAYQVRQVTRSASVGPGTQQNFLRGIPGVSSYFAEVPTPVTGKGNFFDLQNIQALPGPQGTLFGLNSTGGAILVEPKKPTNNLEAYVDGTLGSYSWRIIEGALNVPVIDDKVLVRVAARREVRDGFTEVVSTGERLDNDDNWGWRAAVTLKPTERLENYFVYAGNYLSTRQPGLIPVAFNTAGTIRFLGVANVNNALAAQQALGPRKVAGNNVDDNIFSHRHQIIDILRYEISDTLAIKNIAGLLMTRGGFRYDADNTPLPVYTTTTNQSIPSTVYKWQRQWTEELQVQGNSLENRLSWVVGGFLSYSRPKNPHQLDNGNCSNVFGFASCTGPSASDNQNRTQAFFGQATLDLAALTPSLEGLKLTGGYRYTWDWRSSWNQQFAVNGVTCSNARAGANCIFQQAGKFKAPGWTFSLDYQVLPETLVYVTGRRGYSSGTFNSNVPPGLGRETVDPEYNTDVEIGLKSTFDVGSMQFRTNIAAFQEWYDNVQRITALVFTNAAGATQVIQLTGNAAKAKIRGIDFAGTAKLTDNIEISGNFEILDAKYTRYISADATGRPVDLSGRKFGDTPKFKFTISPKVYLPVDPSYGRISLGLTYARKSSVYYEDGAGTPLDTLPAAGTLDIRADWNDVAGYPVDVSVFVNNVQDKANVTGFYGAYGSLNLVDYLYSEPRMWGVQLRYRFGS